MLDKRFKSLRRVSVAVIRKTSVTLRKIEDGANESAGIPSWGTTFKVSGVLQR